MRTRTFLSLAVVLSGCGTVPTFTDCDGTNITPINISYVQQNNLVRLQVAPNLAYASPGDIIRFKVNGNPAGNFVTIKGKASDPPSAWIDQSGTDEYFFECAPDPGDDTTYEYFVQVTGIGTLDPEVRVRK